MTNELLKHALVYAEKAKWKIFPCKIDKTPHIKNGFYKATSDTEQIKKWWGKWPDASIGMATGEESGVWILDIDMPEGPESLKKIIEEHGPLPETRVQKTGGGGTHYFFKWNGLEVRNTSSKIGLKIDTRGEGGYAILPPSLHPDGGTYVWEKRVDIPYAPKWLTDLIFKKKESVIKRVSHQKRESQYGEKALASELIKLSGVGEGGRNSALNEASFSMGQLIAGGELDEGHVFNTLLGIALSIGLSESEARKTIESGFQAGMQQPRKAPENNQDIEYSLDIGDSNENSGYESHKEPVNNLNNLNNLNVENSSQQISTVLNGSQQNQQNSQQFSTGPEQKAPDNLAGNIRAFIENSTGSFTTRDIDNELGLKTRKEKQARSSALLYMVRNKIINKDRAVAGKYHISNSEIEWVDLDAPAEEQFPIHLPFNLHHHVVIPPKSIIVLAGSTNAGKTAFILNALKLNRQHQYRKMYLMSEMGNGEYVSRLKKFGEPLAEWKSIQAASRSYDFNGAIEHHNKDGLTCIDYLEEVEGKFYEMSSHIRNIYDALGNGVALVAIQKRSDQAIARGGEGTMEKARLCMTLDYLCTADQSIVCALKITKLKNYISENLQGCEMHFKLSHGAQIDEVMPWTPSSRVDRAKCALEYERDRKLTNTDNDSVAPIYFHYADKKKTFRVTEDTIVKWGAEFTNIDVYEEVDRLAKSHNRKPHIKHFNHLVNVVASINNNYRED